MEAAIPIQDPTSLQSDQLGVKIRLECGHVQVRTDIRSVGGKIPGNVVQRLSEALVYTHTFVIWQDIFPNRKSQGH